MTKNKIKIIFMVLAILLCLALAGGLIAQTVVKNNTAHTEEETSAVFTVTPQNTTSKIKLTARTYYDGSEISTYGNETYILTADTSYYSGKITWTTTWTGDEIYWNGDKPTNASDCITLTEINDRSVRVRCLQPFGQQIEIMAALKDSPSVNDTCVCNYKQILKFNELEIGFNTFTKSGALGRGLTNDLGIARANVNLFGVGTLDYRCLFTTTSYTIETSNMQTFDELSFSLTPNYEVIEEFGLEEYNFMTYTVDFQNSISGTIDGFFDSVWGQHAISGTGYSLSDFAEDLCYSTNEDGFAIDSANLYTLTISGLPEIITDVSYGYKVDLYDLLNAIEDLATVSLNKSNIVFGG